MKKFSIFTPTFNRAHTLPRLYKSLRIQNYHNLEWVIVDDGSTDDTKSLIEGYIQDGLLDIKYHFQENAGKHIAINAGLKMASGEWFWIVDSDDFLREGALHNAEYIISQIPPSFTGFSGIHFSDKVNFDSNQFGKKMWTKGGYEWPHPGEMCYIYKTEVFKQFPFPVFKDEKFCQESLILRRIIVAGHQLMNTDYVLLGGDYMEDGLSQNIWNRLKANPRYTMLNISERITQHAYGTQGERERLVKMYWDIARSAPHIPFSEKLAGLHWKDNISYLGTKIFGKVKSLFK